MNTTYTLDHILTLAPDSNSAKAAQKLSPAKWITTHRSDSALWGTYQGSGRSPYKVAIDFDGPAFKCSCPSRKFPCKHGLGLLLVYASEADRFDTAPPPDWVATWLDKRRQRNTNQPGAEPNIKDPEARQKRADRRHRNIQNGMVDLDQRLNDLIGQGLASLQGQGYRLWDELAARLVDAQAPGAARLVGDIAGLPAAGEGWPGRMLEQMALLKLMTDAYQRYDDLPQPVQAEVRGVAGWTPTKTDILQDEEHHDLWVVAGVRFEKDKNLVSRFTWLWGQHTRQAALLLDFAFGGHGFEVAPMPGTAFEGDIIYYPGACPMRAVLNQSKDTPLPTRINGYESAGQALAHYAQALAKSPWLERFPMMLCDVIPLYYKHHWFIQDHTGSSIPTLTIDKSWELMAISGGHPLTVFGEWDGTALLPVSVWDDQQLVILMEAAP